jgi:hypothetical protein
MKTLALVPLRIFYSRAIRQPGAERCETLSEGTVISRFGHFIETTDWNEKNLCYKLIDKIGFGVMILSVIYFCFSPGAYLTEIFFRNYDQWIAFFF